MGRRFARIVNQVKSCAFDSPLFPSVLKCCASKDQGPKSQRVESFGPPHFWGVNDLRFPIATSIKLHSRRNRAIQEIVELGPKVTRPSIVARNFVEFIEKQKSERVAARQPGRNERPCLFPSPIRTAEKNPI